ncbi:MAG: PEP-CTERM sorting domain-containing protein, partial [Bryobacterales bacterium]|nr:PEP-CTERM sorting domain-containing protein [Bryobacterales bacterium]MBL8294577.1 PEP-CTERM sorting domain-containing protein [Bryobacterales bacterium]
DNITAQTPEPSTMVLAGLGLLALAVRRLRQA